MNVQPNHETHCRFAVRRPALERAEVKPVPLAAVPHLSSVLDHRPLLASPHRSHVRARGGVTSFPFSLSILSLVFFWFSFSSLVCYSYSYIVSNYSNCTDTKPYWFSTLLPKFCTKILQLLKYYLRQKKKESFFTLFGWRKANGILRATCVSLEMLLVEVEFGGAFLVEFVAELAQLLGQNRRSTVENTYSCTAVLGA